MKMSDVVIQNLISDGFWLTLIVLVIVFFRLEIKNLMNSLGSFKVAGASFELKDSRSTIESYVVLTNIMVDILIQRDAAVEFGKLLSDLNVRQLSQFALTYAKEVPDDPKQLALVTNIAWIIRDRDVDTALLFYDAVLKHRPGDRDILNLKAGTLNSSDDPVMILQAETIMDSMVAQRPKSALYRNNRAIIKAKLGKYEESVEDLEHAVDLGYWQGYPNMLDTQELAPLRSMPRFQALQMKLAQLRGFRGGQASQQPHQTPAPQPNP
jgi:tetratricopeptide (TPR) repeat protein